MKSLGILGSTGSIGKQTLEIVKNLKNQFSVKYLLANSNDLELLQQIKLFKPKIVCLVDSENHKRLKESINDKSIELLSGIEGLEMAARTKVDICVNAISGYHGLMATIFAAEESIDIALANKESLVMAGSYIRKILKKNGSKIFPVDSEHSAIWQCLRGEKIEDIKNIILTGSGGPFRTFKKSEFKNITKAMALNHPNWKMGKKISIDSATMINKIYEVIEAKNIFNINYKNIKILLHPNSYVHAILKFNNGLIKLIAHDTTMKIPIFNTLYFNQFKKIISKELNIGVLNNLKFNAPDVKRYPMIKLLKLLPVKNSLYETVIVSANDCLVELFLKEKIGFSNIQKELFKIIQSKEFVHYKKKVPKNLDDILNLNNYVRLKLLKKVYKLADVNTAF